MPDKYFINKLEEAGIGLEARTLSLTALAVETGKKEFLDTLTGLRGVQKGLTIAYQEAYQDHIVDKNVQAIITAVLSKYHYKQEIEINNAQFDRAERLISHSRNLSCQVYFNPRDGSDKEFIFNAKHLKPWKKLGIKKEDMVVVYAHHQGGNKERAKIAVNNMRVLLGDELSAKNSYADYIHMDVYLGDERLHCRPSASLVKLANQYPGEVFIKHDENYVDAKQIMGLMESGINKREKIQIAYEPGFADTSKIHEEIQKALAQNY